MFIQPSVSRFCEERVCELQARPLQGGSLRGLKRHRSIWSGGFQCGAMCADRLQRLSLSRRPGKQRMKLTQLFLQAEQMACIHRLADATQPQLYIFAGAQFRLDGLPCPGDRISLMVKKLLDPHHSFNIASAIQALSSATLVRLQLGKFPLPETQDIGRKIAKPRNLTDTKIELVWYGLGRRWCAAGRAGALAGWLLRRHDGTSIGD